MVAYAELVVVGRDLIVDVELAIEVVSMLRLEEKKSFFLFDCHFEEVLDSLLRVVNCRVMVTAYVDLIN